MLKSKKDFCECLESILLPLEKYYSTDCAEMKCGANPAWYGEKTSRMEGFARPLWGLVPMWCGGKKTGNFEELYLKGISAGTDPKSGEYWGELTDYDQKIVECAAIGLALVLTPDKIWDPLSKKEKDNFSSWLRKINSVKVPDNNWRFFSVLVNLGLKNVGEEYDKENIKEAIEAYHSFYLQNGWYTDGHSDQIDYYISFAIHFYSLIYAKVMEKEDPENSNIFKERAMLFARDFIYWFDENGGAIAFGRSLIYRFAQCAFWSACVFAGIEPYPLGVMKGIISRNLEFWLSQPIFDNSSILTLGYGYSNINMTEEYNSFASPYWALKAFLILALDDNDEFFEAEPLAFPKLDTLHTIAEARMVIQHINGSATALTAGQWGGFEMVHRPEKYSKFAYSSKYAFSVPRSYYSCEEMAPDSMLAFCRDGIYHIRKKCIEYKINTDNTIYSKWQPCKGIEAETVIIPTDYGHIRKHKIVSDEECTAYDCSFASDGELGEVIGNGENVVIRCAPNTNLMKPLTKMKAVKYNIKKGITYLETTVVYP